MKNFLQDRFDARAYTELLEECSDHFKVKTRERDIFTKFKTLFTISGREISCLGDLQFYL